MKLKIINTLSFLAKTHRSHQSAPSTLLVGFFWYKKPTAEAVGYVI